MIGIGFFAIGLLALLVFAFVKAITTSRRVDDLEWQMKDLTLLRDRLEQLERHTSPGAKADVPRSSMPPPIISEPSLIPPPTLATLQADPHRIPGTSLPPRTPATPSRTREEWEAFVGGKLLNRIGALALIIGFGFFLKYAFDNEWISQTVRVLIGAAAGFACIAAAYRTHAKGFSVFAQGLVGAGVAILYLSAYASFNFYQLVPQTVAFALMSFVTILAFGQGLYYESLATTLLGWAGGFLTPILLSTGTNNELGLFTYLALVTISLLGMTFKKPEWFVLEPLSFIGLWFYYIAWYREWYQFEAFGLTVFFVFFFWMIFFAADTFRLIGVGLPISPSQHPVAIANALAVFFALFNLIDDPYHAWMGSTVLLLAVVYAGGSVASWRMASTDSFAGPRNDLLAVGLLVTATAIQFSDYTIARWWTLEAVALVVIGLGYRRSVVWRASAALLALAFFKYLITKGAFLTEHAIFFTPVMNERFFTLTLLVSAAGFMAWLFRRPNDGLSATDRSWVVPYFELATACIAFLLVTLELNDFFIAQSKGVALEVETSLLFLRLLVIAFAWVALGFGMNEWAGRVKSELLAASSMLLTTIGALLCMFRGISFEPIETFTPVLNLRVLLMAATALLLVATTKRFVRHHGKWSWASTSANALAIGVVAIVFFLITGETFDHFRALLNSPDQFFADRQRLQNLQQLWLSGMWLLLSLLLMAYGLWRGKRELRIVAFGLFGLTIGKIFLYDLSFLETLYRIYSFIGLGVILLAVSYSYQRYKTYIFGSAAEEKAII